MESITIKISREWLQTAILEFNTERVSTWLIKICITDLLPEIIRKLSSTVSMWKEKDEFILIEQAMRNLSSGSDRVVVDQALTKRIG